MLGLPAAGAPVTERIPIFSVTRDDFEWQYFRAGGKGGQKQNKTSSGVRCSHPPSHSSAEARDQRSQLQNRRSAFRRCVESDSFRKWLKRRSSGAMSATSAMEKQIDRAVERLMAEENLLFESWDGERWVPMDGES